MKLLFFIHSLSAGGAERVTATLANHWAAKEWDVTLLTIAPSGSDFYRLHQSVRRLSLNLAGASRGPLTALWGNLRRLWALRRVLRRERPAVAVAMMPASNSLLAWAARGTGVVAVGSERSYPPRLPMNRFWWTMRRVSYGRLAAVVAQTPLIARWLVGHTSAVAERVHVIPNPVRFPLADGAPRRAPAAEGPAGAKMLIGIGRMGPEKGFDRLLDAFAGLAEQHPGWVLVLLGDGVERPALEARARRLGIRERVRLPGTVGNVGDWLAAADLYALTSRFEGFPNTLLEAMAYGVPAVAVDCENGPRDILRHEIDGFLVPEGDQVALVDSLARLMDDEQLRSRLGGRAIEVRERFSLENVATKWERVFEEVRSGKWKAPSAQRPAR